MGASQQILIGSSSGGVVPPPIAQDINWSNLTTLSTVIVDNEFQAGAGGFASGGSSSQQLLANTLGYIEVVAKTTALYTERLWGLGTTGTGGGYARMNFAIDLSAGGASILIFETGSQVGGGRGSYIAGDILSIARAANGVVTYAKNGSLLYTSLVNNTGVLYANGGAIDTIAHKMENISLNGFT